MSQATLGSSPYRNSELFSGYYLDERIEDLDEWDCDDTAREAFEDLQELWNHEARLVSSYKEDELLSSWIDEVLEILGFGTQSETTLPGGGGYNDRLLFESDAKRREAAERALDGGPEVMYGSASVVLEAKQWDADFTKRFDEQRSYRDASHQIKYYLEHTPEQLQWGVLTDGKKWRLYGTNDYATEIYYEVDLPELLESGDLEEFKYFYAFFRPEAFREVAGASFLNTVWNESELAAQELGEDLQDNVFTALRVLGEGFIHTNDLDLDPDDEDAREELKEQSLVLLYRLMFVLYAESRGLIHPEDPEALAEYEEHFSLDQLRFEIHEDISSGDVYDDYSGYATQMWGQLEDLFGLVDEGKESLGIPPYNGGLFDAEEHEFLAEYEVADRYIAEVIHRLGTTEGEDGEPVLADYADLDTRHLGSIYEGLLEHEFRIAPEPYAAVTEDGAQIWKPGTEVSVAEAVETVEKGELYVVNDDDERKATGAYYTPDYVVNYIIEETLDPLLEDIKSELEADGLDPGDQAYFGRFYSQVQDLRILDPAMGSAHFLTSATGYLTEQVMEVVREQEEQGRDEQEIRRTIAKECIYGVDVNGMAVELGKLAMWLETLAADQPLAFLDHHLKTGNSLVGSDITEVLSDETEENGGQLTLTQAFARARKQTLEHVMNRMQELLDIDNETLSDIKSMEEIYREIRSDPLYQRLFEITNVHTAEEFGLDVPGSVYEEMAGAIDDTDEWSEIQERDWFRSAQVMADDESFFQWELEFPEVFFGEDGGKLDGAGFDAVVGNPPYRSLALGSGQESESEDYLEYLRYNYPDAAEYKSNLYPMFVDVGIHLSSDIGKTGFIIPNTFLTNSSYQSMRANVLRRTSIDSVVDSKTTVFEDAEIGGVTVLILRNEVEPDNKIVLRDLNTNNKFNQKGTIEQAKIDSLPDTRILTTPEKIDLLQKLPNDRRNLGEFSEFYQGIITGDNSRFLSNSKDSDIHKRVVRGRDIDRFHINWGGNYILFDKDELWSNTDEERFNACPKILVRQTSDNLITAVDSQGVYSLDTTLLVYPSEFSTYYISALLNSELLNWYYQAVVPEEGEAFSQVKITNLEQIPIAKGETKRIEEIESAYNDIQSCKSAYEKLNLSLRDHLGSYSDSLTLADIGLTQPPEGSADSILQETTEQKPNLQIGEASIVRESDTTVEIRLTARYKPDPSKKGRDAYTETEPLPALRITNLSEIEANLIEAFVPVAVDKAGGFAEFRDNATQTNSLVDRLQALTLPAVEEVRDGLESYIETKERAEELKVKIKRTDELIDEIVYKLYGLTDEEIDIVEEAVEE